MKCSSPPHSSASPAAPLAFPVSPIPGESIAETVLRAAAENSYQKAGHVLSAAGIRYQGNLSVSAKTIGRECDLAVTLGVSERELRTIIPYPVPNRPGWSDFFGVPIRISHRNMKHRRVAPSSLRQSLHLKAIWSVKVFSFDPLTKERLLDRCPECSCPPTYLRTYGVQYCEFCSLTDDLGVSRGRVDFRDYPQPVIEVEDDEALQFVTDLIDPEGESEGVHLERLHPDISGFGPGDLFEFVVAVACVLTCPPSWNSTYLDRPSKVEDYVRFTPETLAAAGRLILDWPNRFDEIAQEVRASAAERNGHYSVRKELAPLVALTRDPHLPEPMRVLIHRKIKEHTKRKAGNPATFRAEYRPPSDFIPMWEAAPRFAVGEKTILKLIDQGDIRFMRAPDARKAPILVNSRDLEAVLELRRSTMEARSVAVHLGVPRQFLKALVDNGSIVSVARDNAKPGEEFYSKRSVEELSRRCLAMVRDDCPPSGAVRISRAIGQLMLGPRAPWGEVVNRILDGDLEIWSSRSKFSIASSLVRTSLELRNIPPTMYEIGDEVFLSQGEAAAFLGTTAPRVNQLARAGLLPVNPSAGDLKRFAETYMFTPEAIELLTRNGIKIRKRDISPVLQSRGVEPYASVNGTHGYVWRRADIRALFGSVPDCFN